MTEAKIKITVDGKLAWTTAQAATELGAYVGTVRSEVKRLAIEPVAHLDARTPLYAAVSLRQIWRDRPGKGVNLRRA